MVAVGGSVVDRDQGKAPNGSGARAKGKDCMRTGAPDAKRGGRAATCRLAEALTSSLRSRVQALQAPRNPIVSLDNGLASPTEGWDARATDRCQRVLRHCCGIP